MPSSATSAASGRLCGGSIFRSAASLCSSAYLDTGRSRLRPLLRLKSKKVEATSILTPGGCHTVVGLPKPQFGAVVHKTALEGLELITKMARRYGGEEIARVLSKLGRRTGKGNRWSQAPVSYVRKKYAINPPDKKVRDDGILTLAQATQHRGVSDTTLRRLIQEKILTAEQIAPYAPLEIKRADLDSEPVFGILKRLKATGKLLLQGDPPAHQLSLFSGNQ